MRQVAWLTWLSCWWGVSLALPEGAPVETCVRVPPNQPRHGKAEPQPHHMLPYQLIASTSQYGPATEISVSIGGGPFRGFFVQARDAATDQWVGEWVATANTTVHPECAAITHGDRLDKLGAHLVWRAPPAANPGHVYFTGTVLKDYGTFWSNLVAVVPQQQNDFAYQH